MVPRVHPIFVNLECEHFAHVHPQVSKMLTLLNKFATLGCTRAPVWFRQVKTAIPIFVLTTTVLRNPEYGYLLLIIPTPRIGFFSYPDVGMNW